MNILLCGTASGRATHSGFKPYRGKDVNPESFVQVEIDSLGKVWAYLDGHITLTPGDKSAGTTSRATVKDPIVYILGHGNPPYVEFSSLPKETQVVLIKHHFGLLVSTSV